KIDPAYSGAVVHVLDASRSVPVASELISKETHKQITTRVKGEYAVLRKEHESKQTAQSFISLVEARKNAGSVTQRVQPKQVGRFEFLNFPLETLRAYIDWTPFFQTWMLAGRYPGILQDAVVGTEAKKLFDDANRFLDDIIKHKKLTANGVVSILPAKKVQDDVKVYQNHVESTFHFLRQQNKKVQGQPNFCLADFIAEENDYVGMFAVTAGMGLEELVAQYKTQHDDYAEIMVKALADRLAEAFAECLHEKVRKEIWGYATDEKLSNEELIEEKYKGIRPAPGYPACPDHTEKALLFELLQAEKIGIHLTESFAMYPAAAVSGFYFANPESRYFGLGKIYKDQVEDYAKRKGWTIAETEKWLSPNLGYQH
ncbi:MAG: vitamin B12 dependent-methionine synthase activation domain-containing protein, partial [Chryseotalea sp.]